MSLLLNDRLFMHLLVVIISLRGQNAKDNGFNTSGDSLEVNSGNITWIKF